MTKPWRSKQSRSLSRRARDQSGIGLVSVLVSTAIGTMMLLAMLSLITQNFRATRSAEIKGDLVSLKETLRQVIDCNAIWEGNQINPAVDCLPAATARPMVLRNRSGGAITGELQPVLGQFSPIDKTFAGSGQLGNWRVRAYCDADKQSLVVRVAAGNPSLAGFYSDPLTGRPMDWQSPSNPIFGGPTSVLCGTKFNALPNLISCIHDTTGTAVKTVAGPNMHPFSAADCGGTLPTNSYVGAVSVLQVNNGNIGGFRIYPNAAQGGAAGLWFWSNVAGTDFSVSVTYFKKGQ